jgi:hypothetical protein
LSQTQQNFECRRCANASIPCSISSWSRFSVIDPFCANNEPALHISGTVRSFSIPLRHCARGGHAVVSPAPFGAGTKRRVSCVHGSQYNPLHTTTLSRHWACVAGALGQSSRPTYQPASAAARRINPATRVHLQPRHMSLRNVIGQSPVHSQFRAN